MPGGGESQTSGRWAVHAPVIAFERDTLLYAILAVSSAHLSTLSPHTTQYHIAAKYYFGIVLHQLNQGGGTGTGMDRLKLNVDNVVALCLTCMIIPILANHFQDISDRPTSTTTTSSHGGEPAGLPIPIKGMCISHRSGEVIMVAWHWIRQSPSSEAAKILKKTPVYQEVVNHRTAEWHTSSHGQAVQATGQVVYPIDHCTAMQELQNINEEQNEDNSRRSRSVLLSAISEN